ncbi:maleylpyruvate isomerase family mycothiol-dependent enzyme [Streptomyces huasconensis]|uniref:Maleylpyruvate isomerase family mycothiol-dependent enzyme n=1 Tax=Streptomyces huasconensis TaxID=1854574 RepID=A0ABV3LXD4_9ACTN
MTTTAPEESYEPERAGRLLRTERDALIPLLRSAPDEAFALRTCCPGWTVRHVIAHCGSALMRVVENRFEEGVFSAESNERDIAERADWSPSRLVDELERGMTEAGNVMAAAKGILDGIALGEWVHAGDIREAWGEPGAYGGDGLADALPLLELHSRGAYSTAAPGLAVHADVDGRDEPLVLGATDGRRPPARYIGDAPTLVRLCAGRPLTGTRYELAGAREKELVLFG